MIVIQGKDLAKAYGGLTVLKQVTFSVNAGDKVGVVGPNGAGKTTLFHCLTGQELPDAGQVMIGSGLSLGALEQEPGFAGSANTLAAELMTAFAGILELRTNIEQLMREMEEMAGKPDRLTGVMAHYEQTLQQYEEQDGYAVENKVRQVAAGLGFTAADLKRRVSQFSGGQQTRISLGKLLLNQPDIMLLDEPTNYLDVAGSEWLGNFLKSYQGTIIVISHDRYFLEEICTKILELEQGKVKLFPGNYSNYKRLQAEQQKADEKALGKQQKYILETEKYIERYRAGIKAKQARGRQKQLDRLDRLEHPEKQKELNKFQFLTNKIPGERVLELAGLNFSYGREEILRNVTGLIRRGEKVALVGHNGCGKTTLLKIFTGMLKPLAGEIRFGSNVEPAYYSQQHEDLTLSSTVLEEIINSTGVGDKEARRHLGRFLFSQEEVDKQVGDLSGGEKSRLALMKLFIIGANLLFLDEPTNHLDIRSREVLEQALTGFTGTAVIVSHDRYFLDQIVDKVWAFDPAGSGEIIEYQGNYSYYRQKKEEQVRPENESVIDTGKTSGALKFQEEKEQQREEKRLRRHKEKELAAIEQKIMDMEEEKETLGKSLANPETYQNGEKAKELTDKFNKVDTELLELYRQWELSLL